MYNFKFELKETVIDKERKIKLYQNSFYGIEIDGTFVYVSKLFIKNEFLPELYLYRENGQYKTVKIQTISYGSLEIAEIEKMIENLNIAKESAIELEKLLRELNLIKSKF